MERSNHLISGIFARGFTAMPNVVQRSKKLSVEAKAIYAHLMMYGGQEKVCYPSLEKMSDELGMTKKRIISHRKQLEEHGLLKVIKGGGGKGAVNNTYIIVTDGEEIASFLEDEGIKKADSVPALPTVKKPSNEKPTSNDTKPAKKSKYKYNEKDMAVAERLWNHVKMINQAARKPNLEAWANNVRLMHERDGLLYKDIGAAVQFLEQDKRFWFKVVQSTENLRKNYDKIAMEMQDQARPGKTSKAVNPQYLEIDEKMKAKQREREKEMEGIEIDLEGLF